MLVFILVIVMSLATMVGFIRLEGFAELRLVKLARETTSVELSLSALKTLAVSKALERQEQGENPFSFSFRVMDFEIEVEIWPFAPLLDLNQAGEEELRALFVELGFEEHQAEVMAQSLLDWRDADHDHRPFGAEDEFYELLGYRPRNGPLSSLKELALVRGFDPYVIWVDPGLWHYVTLGEARPASTKKQMEEQVVEEESDLLEEGAEYCIRLDIRHAGRLSRLLGKFRLQKGTPRFFWEQII